MKMRWILVILVTFLLIGLMPMVVIAAPPVPYRPQGTVQLNNANVPDGTAITAFCSGVQYGYTESFTSSGVSKYTMNVSGDDPGTPEKDGCSQGETVVFEVATTIADQEGIWNSGTQTLNLTATKPIPDI
ncbi:MAG TPA: hypothetical protein VIM80_01580, partial [Brevefilum sp.]